MLTQQQQQALADYTASYDEAHEAKRRARKFPHNQGTPQICKLTPDEWILGEVAVEKYLHRLDHLSITPDDDYFYEYFADPYEYEVYKQGRKAWLEANNL